MRFDVKSKIPAPLLNYPLATAYPSKWLTLFSPAVSNSFDQNIHFFLKLLLKWTSVTSVFWCCQLRAVTYEKATFVLGKESRGAEKSLCKMVLGHGDPGPCLHPCLCLDPYPYPCPCLYLLLYVYLSTFLVCIIKYKHFYRPHFFPIQDKNSYTESHREKCIFLQIRLPFVEYNDFYWIEEWQWGTWYCFLVINMLASLGTFETL